MQSSQEIKKRIRRKRRNKRMGRLLLVLAAAAAAGAALLLLPRLMESGQESAQEQTYAIAKAYTGDIERLVYGTGSVQPISQPGVYAQVDGTVVSTHVSMGDSVRAGDVLVVLKNETLESEIAELQIALDDAQEAVEDVKTYEARVDRQLYWEDGTPRMNVDTGEPLTANYSNELMIRAPVKGRVMAIYIEEGDDALAKYREHGSVFMLSTDGKMKVELENVKSGLLTLNEQVQITGVGVDTTGRVIDLTRHGTQAHIEVIGDEYPMDAPVSVFREDGTLLGEGILEINKPLGVSAYGGTVGSVVVKVGQMVEKEDRLARFALREKPLYIDNDAILREYAVALASLETAQKKIDDLTLVAPCDGKVVSVDVSAGDEVTDGTLLVTLVEDAGMEIILTVDELDIPLVEKGQQVTMTVDALSGVTITGEVLKIAPLGNTETSVTTYDVYILAQDVDERVLGGMNVSGEILVGGAQNAVLIPTDAIRKDAEGYFVMLQGGEIRRIETGIMTVESTQVLSGLEVGETIAY